MRGLVVALVLLAVPAQATAADVSVSGNRFTPSSVTVAPGDSVTWTFAGPDTNHSATSNPGQPESWDSDPGIPFPNHLAGDRFSHTFTTPGAYSYFCKVHSFMTGRILVQDPNAPPPDTAAPALTSARVNVAKRRVTFALDEAARVEVVLRGPTRRTVALNGRAGSNVLKLPRMKAGRYALTLRATDAAGNKGDAVRVKFRVARPKR